MLVNELYKTFYVKEVFKTFKRGSKLQVPTGSQVAKTDLFEGKIPRISVSSVNNGIIGYFRSNDKNYRVYNNFISVSFLGTVFYQESFASLDMKVHCLKPLHFSLNHYTGLYIVSIIRKQLSMLSYSEQISSSQLTDLMIELPVDQDGKINLQYMESKMKSIEDKATKNLKSFINISNLESKKINTTEWKRFSLYDSKLFIIDKGNKFDKLKMKELNPSINFVGRSNVNNGVTAKVDEIPDYPPYPSGCLTLALGGEYLGSCFIQTEKFYTSQNVNVLIPTWDMPDEIKLFISAMIFLEGRTFYKAFIDELNRHIKTDFTILLPIKNEFPDWEYMKKYIRQKNKLIEENLKHLITNFELQ